LIKSFSENNFSGINYRGKVYDNITVSNDLEVIAQSGQKYSTITIKNCKASFGRYNAYLPAVKFINGGPKTRSCQYLHHMQLAPDSSTTISQQSNHSTFIINHNSF
jgi:hypothetical protein